MQTSGGRGKKISGLNPAVLSCKLQTYRCLLGKNNGFYKQYSAFDKENEQVHAQLNTLRVSVCPTLISLPRYNHVQVKLPLSQHLQL